MVASHTGAQVGADESIKFVQAHTKPGARLLDAGCGDGIFAKHLIASGYVVTAIDNREEAVEKARANGIDALLADITQYKPDAPFDVVLLSRAFHHMHPIDRAVDQLHKILAPQGQLLILDFAAEEFDARCAAWFYGLKALLQSMRTASHEGSAGGAGGASNGHERGHTPHDPGHPHGPQLENGKMPADLLKNWHEHHFGKHHVADSHTMFDALNKKFDIVSHERTPYLYLYFLDEMSGDDARHLIEWEKRLSTAGAITPIGLQIVARPKHINR